MASGRSNAPPMMDLNGNAAAVLCMSCGGPYLVSAYTDRQIAAHWQGWRVCPHCQETEATIYWDGYDDRDRPLYKAEQRMLSAEERREVAQSEPTAINGNHRLLRDPQRKKRVTGYPERWR